MEIEEAGSCRARHYDDTVLGVDRIQQLLERIDARGFADDWESYRNPGALTVSCSIPPPFNTRMRRKTRRMRTPRRMFEVRRRGSKICRFQTHPQ